MDALKQAVRHSDFVADEVEEAVNDLLKRWHNWSKQDTVVAGFNTCSSAMEQFRASRQYDADNGVLDQDIENRIMASVEFCIDCVDQPYRTALWINARNLSTGLTVWRSARLPTDAMARALMVGEARALLVHQFEQYGGLL